MAQDTGEPVEGAQLDRTHRGRRVVGACGAVRARAAGPGEFDDPAGCPRCRSGCTSRSRRAAPSSVTATGPTARSRAGASTIRGMSTGLVIRLPRGGEVSGTVRDDQGRPVAGAPRCGSRTASTAARGRRPLTGPGAYRIGGIAPSARMIVHAWTPGMVDQWFDRRQRLDSRRRRSTSAPARRAPGWTSSWSAGESSSARSWPGTPGAALTGVPAYLEARVGPEPAVLRPLQRLRPRPATGSDRCRRAPTGSCCCPTAASRSTGRRGGRRPPGSRPPGSSASTPGSEAEVVVTLARSQSDPDCHEPAGLAGPVPRVPGCGSVAGCCLVPSTRARTAEPRPCAQRDWSVTGLAKTTPL